MKVNSILNEDKISASSVTKSSTSNNNVKFSSYLGETKSLDSIFQEAAEKYNVPVNLLKAIGKAESNFDPNVVSSAGACGVMQLMPGTAKYLGVTDSFDPEQNIMGGSKYISEMLNKYDGDVKLALAAYNAGSGNVAKYGGIPPFEETQNYVVKVTKYMNEGVSTGNKTVTVPSSTSTTNPLINNTNIGKYTINTGTTNSELFTQKADMNNLDDIFSKNDYLEFLEKYLLGDKEDKKENNKEENPNYFASKSINYSVAVMNLLKS